MNDTLIHTVGSSASLDLFLAKFTGSILSQLTVCHLEALALVDVGLSLRILVPGCLYVPQLGIIQGNSHLTCSRTFARRLTTPACPLFFRWQADTT